MSSEQRPNDVRLSALLLNPDMACPLCGDPCTCSIVAAPGDARPAVRVPENTSPRRACTTQSDSYRRNEAAHWRSEVSSRVRAHRRRRGHDDSSLALDFGNDQQQPLDAPLHSSEEFEKEPAPSRYHRIELDRREARMENGLVIKFPKPTIAEMFPDQPGPLPAVPRILEAPEPHQAGISSMLAGIELDSPHPQPENAVEFELPLQVASLTRRIVSAIADGVIVLAVFAAIVFSLGQFVPEGKWGLALAAVAPALFWTTYHYLFLVYAGMTPGMQLTHLELATFEGVFPSRETRVLRAVSLLLSCMSLGLGFIWAVMDEDGLGWHDRITRTYLRRSYATPGA